MLNTNSMKLFENFMKYNKKVEKPLKLLKESDDAANNADEPLVYMNTWKNYNENGADLTMYGDIDGWMTVEKAKEFAQKHQEDEPFINDTDNIPWEITEYDNVNTQLDYIEQYQNADDKNIILALIDDQGDVESAFNTYESGEYSFFNDVSDETELGLAYYNSVGYSGLSNIDSLIDMDKYKESFKDIVEETVREDNPELESEDEDKFEEIVEKTLDDVAQEQLNVEISDGEDLSNYIDYTKLGNQLIDSGFTITDYGAIQVF